MNFFNCCSNTADDSDALITVRFCQVVVDGDGPFESTVKKTCFCRDKLCVCANFGVEKSDRRGGSAASLEFMVPRC